MDKLIAEFGKARILETGILKQKTLEAYIEGTRKPRTVTTIAVAEALGVDWRNYVA